MGFGFGAGADMMKDYSRNQAQLKKGKSFKDIISVSEKPKKNVQFEKISQAELEEFRMKFLEKKRIETIKSVSILVLIALIIFGVFVWVFF